jgi:CelD/BcsL family acetyltransferase involved in cellulose biosynthesis
LRRACARLTGQYHATNRYINRAKPREACFGAATMLGQVPLGELPTVSYVADPNAGDLEVKIVEERSAFDALEGPWRALDAHSMVRPFQEFGWVSSWVRTIGLAGGWHLRVGTLWQGGRLVAVLPLCVRRYKGVRILEWIGARVTDYCDAIIAPGLDGDAHLRLVWEAINRRGGFDVARLSHVRTDARIFNVLNALNPWVETLEDAGGIPIVWNSGAEWLQAQTPGMRDRVKRNSRRMTKAGYEVHVSQASEDCRRLIDTLVAQKRPWLAARNLTSFLDEPAGVEFLKSAVEEFARRGELHLSIVRMNEHVAAVDLTFEREGILYSYIASFDPEFAKYSFGRILTDCLIMWACDSGKRRLDLLLGAYDYKKEYNCTTEPVRTFVIARGLLGRAAVTFYRRRATRA